MKFAERKKIGVCDLNCYVLNLFYFLICYEGAFLLYHLASNQDKQEKLYRELRDVLGHPGAQITEAKLANLKYLKVSI